MRVFISHFTADSEVAAAIERLLKDGIPDVDVFRSSSKGMIPNGEFFVQEILSVLSETELTVALLSPGYFTSPFCLAELGTGIVRKLKGEAFFRSYIIPPTTVGDLTGVMYGVQTEPIDDSVAIDNLCRTLRHDVADAAWRSAKSSFEATLAPELRIRKSQSALRQIVIHDLYREPSDDPKIIFSNKARILLKNNTDMEIQLVSGKWQPGAEGAPLQNPPQDKIPFQLEGPKGWHKNDWLPEKASVFVPPGVVFRTWLGLHQSLIGDEIRQRHEAQRLGQLTLDVTIDGCPVRWVRQI